MAAVLFCYPGRQKSVDIFDIQAGCQISVKMSEKGLKAAYSNALSQNFVIFRNLIATQTIVDKICYAVMCT